MNKLEAAVGTLARRGQEAQSQLQAGRRQRIGNLLQPLDMKLKVLVERPLLAGRPDRRIAAVGSQSGADLPQQANLPEIGLQVFFSPRPANGQLKAANSDLGTA